MDLRIELFLHGVPAGHMMCGKVDEQDRAYINGSYNKAEWDVPEFMKVERIGDKAYYTFMKCSNVSDAEGRSGSYFGITLRMNAYYADIQNIYSLLKAIYKKLCVGVYISDNGSRVQFLVSDFKLKAAEFTKIREMALTTVGYLTSQQDLVDINKIPASGSHIACVNFDDCNINAAYQLLASNGCLKVSPDYPAQATRRMKQQFEQKLEQTRQEHDKGMKQLQMSHSADMAHIKRQLQDKEQTIIQKEKENQKGKREMQDRIDSLQKEIESLQDKVNKQAEEKRNFINHLLKAIDSVAPDQKESGPHGSSTHGRDPSKKKNNMLLILFILLILLAGNIYLASQNRVINDSLRNQREEIGRVCDQVCTDAPTDSVPLALSKVPAVHNYNLRIDIKGLKYDRKYKEDGPYIKRGSYIDVTLQEKGTKKTIDNLKGKWEADAEILSQDSAKARLWVKRDYDKASVTIFYIVSGVTVAEREVGVLN